MQTEWTKVAANGITGREIHFSRSAVLDFAVMFVRAQFYTTIETRANDFFFGRNSTNPKTRFKPGPQEQNLNEKMKFVGDGNCYIEN